MSFMDKKQGKERGIQLGSQDKVRRRCQYAIMHSVKIIGIVGYEDVRTGGRVEKWRWWRVIFHMEVARRQ